MRKRIILIVVLSCVLAGCSRDNPSAETTGPETATLKPLSMIDLSPGITEPSGIVYNRKNNTLMVVSDSRSDVFEINLNGVIQKTIPTTATDLEGISISAGGDSLFLAEERNQVVDTYSRAGMLLSSLPVKVATLANNALEGVAIDSSGHLWVINEKNPRLLLEFAGTQELSRKEITLVDDLSDICCDETDQSLWIISDESRKIFKITRTGSLLKEWDLPFSKGEGITFAGDKMYIVNDQDAKLYIFAKPF